MKTYQTFRLWAALWMAATVSIQAQTPVRVVGNNVNLRAKPQLTAEVVAQVHYDDQLAARDIGDEWVEVAAPATVDLWISKDLIQTPQNTISARRVNVRAGPSINYNVVGTLERGETVEPREELGDWLKIAPPPSASLWIHREYVERLADEPVSPEALAEVEPAAIPEQPVVLAVADPRRAPPATELPTPIVSPSVPMRDAPGREIPPPPPADLRLIPLEGQGRLAVFEGELRAAPLISEAPTRYRVVRWQNNRWQVLCHVYGEAAKFRSLQDKRVRVNGREYWIQGAAAPVLVPDQIQEVPGDS